MELIIISIAIIAIIIVRTMMHANLKELEKLALDSKLNDISKRYPKNKEICKTLLQKLKNNHTKIEEDIGSDATMYIAILDKILIGNTHDSFTRIQTMAHECLHSIQDKKMLIFNFIYSNIYLLYYSIICILVIARRLPNETIFLNIFLILSFIYYVIRVFLENDAMIKAEFLAKEYMQEQEISSKEEIIKVSEGFEKLNKGCIKETNYNLFLKIMIKVAIFSALALIF